VTEDLVESCLRCKSVAIEEDERICSEYGDDRNGREGRGFVWEGVGEVNRRDYPSVWC